MDAATVVDRENEAVADRESGAVPDQGNEAMHDHESGAMADASAGRATRRGSRRGKVARELGRRGEEAAARYLDRRGYEIVARNWQCAAGEADIVARDGDALVFVEVKTRSSCEQGMPAEAVTRAKRDRYERIAALYLQGNDVTDVPVRFDIVSLLVVAPERAMVRHHINAFGTD